MDEVDAIVAGAGVIGLAVARKLALEGRSVLLLEASGEFGSGTSSRNSEVIHAGIYYPEGSLKGSTCVAGRNLLYAHLQTHQVAHRRCGKFIVATHQDQIEKLEEIRQRALLAGVDDLEWRTPSQVHAHEPHVRCVSALWSPSTGIVDSHAYMQSLLADMENHGGLLVTHTPIVEVSVRPAGGFVVRTGGEQDFSIGCQIFVNSAGLGAQKLARTIDGLDAQHVPPLYYSRGNYFVLSGKTPFSHLIYPVPEPGGLGVHVTLDLGGQARFGPDVEWIESERYDLDPGRANAFYSAIRKYFPALPDGSLVPGYCGIRPKLKAAGQGDADFVISGPTQHGVGGLVNLFGIESPGLTASLAIANLVFDSLQ